MACHVRALGSTGHPCPQPARKRRPERTPAASQDAGRMRLAASATAPPHKGGLRVVRALTEGPLGCSDPADPRATGSLHERWRSSERSTAGRHGQRPRLRARRDGHRSMSSAFQLDGRHAQSPAKPVLDPLVSGVAAELTARDAEQPSGDRWALIAGAPPRHAGGSERLGDVADATHAPSVPGRGRRHGSLVGGQSSAVGTSQTELESPDRLPTSKGSMRPSPSKSNSARSLPTSMNSGYSANHVRGPTRPSTSRPLACWNPRRTALFDLIGEEVNRVVDMGQVAVGGECLVHPHHAPARVATTERELIVVVVCRVTRRSRRRRDVGRGGR